MIIEKIKYPEIGPFTDAENYVYSLCRKRHAPNTFGGVSYKNRNAYIKVDDDGRLISFILLANNNIDGVKGKGREIVSIKAWDRCFDETYSVEHCLAWLIYYSWCKGFYVWYRTEDSKPCNIGDLTLFQELGDGSGTFMLKKPKMKNADDNPLRFLDADVWYDRKKEKELKLTNEPFYVEKLKYPDLNVMYAEDYVDDLYESKHHPDNFDWVKIDKCEFSATIDNDNRLILFIYGVPENINGVGGDGFRFLGVKAWDRCFDETDYVEFIIHNMVSWANRHFDYSWFYGDENTPLYGELKGFKKHNGAIYIKKKN